MSGVFPFKLVASTARSTAVRSNWSAAGRSTSRSSFDADVIALVASALLQAFEPASQLVASLASTGNWCTAVNWSWSTASWSSRSGTSRSTSSSRSGTSGSTGSSRSTASWITRSCTGRSWCTAGWCTVIALVAEQTSVSNVDTSSNQQSSAQG